METGNPAIILLNKERQGSGHSNLKGKFHGRVKTGSAGHRGRHQQLIGLPEKAKINSKHSLMEYNGGGGAGKHPIRKNPKSLSGSATNGRNKGYAERDTAHETHNGWKGV